MSRRLRAGLLLLGLLTASGVGIAVARWDTGPRLGDAKSGSSPWLVLLVFLLAAGATVLTTRSRPMRWFAVLVLLLFTGTGLYLLWLQHEADRARENLALIKDQKAKRESWKERWQVKYGEYRKLRAAGEKPPAALLTELTRLRLEWVGIVYHKVAMTGGPPQNEGDLSKEVPDWKELGKDSPLVIVWGADRARLAERGNRALLGWEANADETGHRCVLLADGTTEFVDDEMFRGMPRATDR